MAAQLEAGVRTVSNTVPGSEPVLPSLVNMPALLRSLSDERLVPQVSLPGVAAPQINWTPIGTDTPPQILVAAPAKAPAWQSDFVNHLARTEAQRNPNANLRVQINLAPKVSANLSALHSIV
jgi:hypothetical protein